SAPHANATKKSAAHTETYRCEIHRTLKIPPTKSHFAVDTPRRSDSPYSSRVAIRKTIHPSDSATNSAAHVDRSSLRTDRVQKLARAIRRKTPQPAQYPTQDQPASTN